MKFPRAGDVHEYILIEDRDQPVNRQTVFMLRALIPLEIERVHDDTLTVSAQVRGMEVGTTDQFRRCLLACRYGLRGWRRLNDERGRAIPFKSKREGDSIVVTDESLNWLQPWIEELGLEVLSLTQKEISNG